MEAQLIDCSSVGMLVVSLCSLQSAAARARAFLVFGLNDGSCFLFLLLGRREISRICIRIYRMGES